MSFETERTDKLFREILTNVHKSRVTSTGGYDEGKNRAIEYLVQDYYQLFNHLVNDLVYEPTFGKADKLALEERINKAAECTKAMEALRKHYSF